MNAETIAADEYVMDTLPHTPRTLADYAEADLRRAARLIIKLQDEIDWQFRIATEKCRDWHLAVTMPADPRQLCAMLYRIKRYMTSLETVAFTLATELKEPDAVYTLAISRFQSHHCLARITRQPRPWTVANFGPVEHLPTDAIDPQLTHLMPRMPNDLPEDVSTEARIELEDWFGPKGKFPAIEIERAMPSPSDFRNIYHRVH